MARPRRLADRIAAEGVRLAGAGQVVMPSKPLQDGRTGPGGAVFPVFGPETAQNAPSGQKSGVLDPVYAAMSEAELQKHVIGTLKRLGWWVWVVPDMRKTAAGLPDIVAAHPERDVLLAWELKTERGRVRPEQRLVIELLARNPGIDARIVRPSSWPAVRKALEHGSEG